MPDLIRHPMPTAKGLALRFLRPLVSQRPRSVAVNTTGAVVHVTALAGGRTLATPATVGVSDRGQHGHCDDQRDQSEFHRKASHCTRSSRSRNTSIIAIQYNTPLTCIAGLPARPKQQHCKEITEGLLNHIEVAIRAFDPCLSCATHALGQMPLIVTLEDASGAEIARGVKE